MDIYKILDRIEKMTEELASVEGEFETLKNRCTQVVNRREGLYSERMKLVDELMELCKHKS